VGNILRGGSYLFRHAGEGFEVKPQKSGPELAAEIRQAARQRGVSLTEILRPFWPGEINSILARLEITKQPLPVTIAKVEALIAGNLGETK
jgi:urease accessory protein UreF